MDKYILYCDGASRGNPGPGAYGYVLFCSEQIVDQKGESIGNVTNNEAEYRGLVEGLTAARALGAKDIEVRSDSQLLVRQLNGEYKVKAANLIPLFQTAQQLLRGFEEHLVSHIPREQNAMADALCNKALDDLR